VARKEAACDKQSERESKAHNENTNA